MKSNSTSLRQLTAILFLITSMSAWCTSPAQALELGSPFLNDMILQRQMQVPVWGWAGSGDKVTVTFASQSKTATADKFGKWMVHLDPLKASARESKLVVTTATGKKATRTGVLVGEVWFSSGQSNMHWVAGKSMCRNLAGTLQRSKEDIPVREFNADSGSALFLRDRVTAEGGWKRSKHASGFSALSLAFAWELYTELKVPIGILRSTHGATPIETWTSYEGFASHPKLQHLAMRIRQSNPSTPESNQAYTKYFEDLKNWQIQSEILINDGGTALPRPPLPGIGDEWKGPTRMYNFKIAPLVPYAVRGAIWCQGTSNGNDGKIYAAKMEALVNGWRKVWGRPDLPFYFTQQQSYGAPDPNHVGFADLREAQRLFFMNAKNVGMVPQHDLNPANPGNIHYFNKLDPGKRLARWALAKNYGKEIAYTGPIYQSHSIEGNTVRVQFDQPGPGGSLMIASKGMQVNYSKDPSAYVEPARETKGVPLKHFRLAGKDKVWHPAEAVIEGNQVVVTSKAVPKPMGVQYAYSATPIGANLYNRAGLPAAPFAYFNGKQMFNEDDPVIVAAAKAEAERKWGKKTYLLPMSLLRDHGVLQRDMPVPIWGHGVPGTTVTVSFGDQSKKAKVGKYEKWLVTLDPMPAGTEGKDLKIVDSAGGNRTIKDIVVGDIWIITGSRNAPGEVFRTKAGEKSSPKALPQVREFRIKTKARRFPRPRKKRLEIGGGKYVASWQPADFDGVGDPPSVAAYYFASKVKKPDIPVGIVTLGSRNPPLTWISHKSLQTAVGFEKQRDELNLAYPNTDACKTALANYIKTISQYNHDVAALLEAGKPLPDALAISAPPFPQPYYNQWASRTETATHTYNFCISPITPFAIRGVVWIPDKDNIPENVAEYAPSLRAYAASLPQTYGQDQVIFIYAQPATKLVSGIADPMITGARRVEFHEWSKSLRGLATQLGETAAK